MPARFNIAPDSLENVKWIIPVFCVIIMKTSFLG